MPVALFAQQQLYYFQDSRTMLLGVKDQSGKLLSRQEGMFIMMLI